MKTRNATYLALSLWAAAAAFTGAGCHSKPESAASSDSMEPKVTAGRIVFPENSPQLASLAISAVKPCADCRLRLNGRLAWDDDVTVRVFSPFAGRITHVVAEPGARVEKDAVLARVASPDFGQAQTDARKAATDLALAERNVSRLHELDAHGAAAAKDVAAAEADLARAQSEASRTSARLALYGVTTDVIDNAYALKSPIGGVVVERNLNPGQEVRPDQMLAGVERLAAPLFVVTDPSKLWLMLDVTEADASKLKVGQVLEVRVPSHPERVFQGVLNFESDSMDPSSRMVKARAVVMNPDRLLKAEQLVNVEFAVGDGKSVLDVPAAAVFLKGEKHFVFAESAIGTFVRREVSIGASHQGHLQIVGGLEPGERVVTDGVMLLEQLWENGGEQATQAAAEPSPASIASKL